MSRFNTKTVTAKARSAKTRVVDNLAGGQAYSESPKLELASILLTSFVQDKFYRSASQEQDRLGQLLDSGLDPLFAAKAAIYARNEFGMRSITHVMASEIAKRVKGSAWTSRFFDRVVRRPDDATEIVAYYLSKYGKPFPNSLKRGLATRLARFDSYRIAKYRGKKNAVSLIDVIRLCHPKRTEAIDALYKGTLAPAETWETKLTQAGQKSETDEQKLDLKASAWQELLSTGKLGYLATLRNLRNIAQQAPNCIDMACDLITNPEQIRKSLTFPFQYFDAMEELQESNIDRRIITALSTALEYSVSNVPKFPGKVLVAVDASGSMTFYPQVSKIASIFGAILYRANDADLMLFDTKAKYISPNTADSVMTISDFIKKNSDGGGTDFHLIFNEAKKAYDYIVILSDMQGWVGYNTPKSDYDRYCNHYSIKPHVFSFDLAGQGTLQLPENRVYCLAGFSNKIFDIMEKLAMDRNALVNTIEAVVI